MGLDIPSYLLGKKSGGGGGGGTTVIANPTLEGTEDALTGLQVDETKYKVPVVTYGNTDLTPGTSALTTGEFYFYYE